MRSDFNVFRGGYKEQLTQGFRPRRDVPPILLRLPINWDMDPLRDRNWRFQLQAWRMLQPIWSEFFGRDWVRLKAELMPWICDWYRFHICEQQSSELMWQDMATGIRAQHLALLIWVTNQGHIVLDPHEQVVVDELVAMHVAKLRSPSFISSGNHGIFQVVGLRLLGVVLEGHRCVVGEESYSSELLGRLLRSQFGEQAVHVENSPAYHAFAAAHFERIRPELFPQVQRHLRRTVADAKEVSPWLTLPNGYLAGFGDTEGVGPKLPFDRRADREAKSCWGDRVLMRDLSAGGYVTVRTDVDVPPHRAEMLIVKGQAVTSGHAHADQLSFELFAHGRPLFVDSGKYRYDSSKWRRYFVSDRAHNVVGLASRSFKPEDTVLNVSRLTHARCEAGKFYIEGCVLRGGDFMHHRKFEYVPGKSLTLRDHIEADATRMPVVYLHLAAHVTAKAEGGAIVVWSGKKRLARIVYDAESFRPRLKRGAEKPYIQGWVSPSYGKRVPALAVELVARAPITDWRVDIELEQPRSCDDDFTTKLPDGLTVPFLAECRLDRSFMRQDGRLERRVILEFFNETIAEMADCLDAWFKEAGYTKSRVRVEPGVMRSWYQNVGSASKVSALVRTPESFEVRSPGAAGSVYLAFVLSSPAGS